MEVRDQTAVDQASITQIIIQSQKQLSHVKIKDTRDFSVTLKPAVKFGIIVI